MNLPNEVTIKAPARLHMTLISLSKSGYRKNGGLGFAINGFDTEIRCEISSSNSVEDHRCDALEKDELNLLNIYLERAFVRSKLSRRIACKIVAGPPPHSGFGVGTTTKLALIEALYLINGVELSQTDLVELSKRGGTSGIGVNTYFSGGYIFDVGVRASSGGFYPSAVKETSSFVAPRVLIKSPMPRWRIGVWLGGLASRICGEKEKSFFEENTPIAQADVETACYHSVMGISAAVVEGDYEVFSQGINNLQCLRWKRSEWGVQSPVVNEVREALFASGASSVGLSSLGPALYFTLGVNWDGSVMARGKSQQFKIVLPNNLGRTVERA